MRILAIDFGGTKVSVGCGDAGAPPATRREAFPRGATAPVVLDHARRMASDLLAPDGGRAMSDRPVDLVSVVTPGRVVDGALTAAPNVPGWERVDLTDWAQRHWPGAQVILTNDVAAAAAAELHNGALAGCDVGLYVNIGTGIAAALTVGEDVIAGHAGLAGEIGYAYCGQTAGSWADPSATLENVAGGRAFAASRARIPTDHVGAIDVDSESRVRLDEIARHLLTCILLTDPQRTVLGGGLGSVPAVAEHLRRRLDRAALRPVDIRVSQFGADGSLAGALAIGLRESSSHSGR